MTFTEFQATRKWCNDIAHAIGSVGWADDNSGQMYAENLFIESALNIEGATGEWCLTIGNVQTFGDLEILERQLYDWATSEGYFEESAITTRLQIPAYTDRWMMGDRYGGVIGTYVMEQGEHEGEEIARVRLDKSGKVVRVVYAHCVEV